MDFTFTSTDAALTNPVPTGLGAPATDIAGVTVWQQSGGYQFSWHTGTHGDPCVYIRETGKTGYNLPCRWFGGSKSGDWRGTVKSQTKTDVDAVINANAALFQTMYDNFYGTGTPAPAPVAVAVAPALLTCKKCKKNAPMPGTIPDTRMVACSACHAMIYVPE